MLNNRPTPYETKRRSRVTVVKGASAPPVTLTPLAKGMVTGTLGSVPLTSDVYAQIRRTQDPVSEPIATVLIAGEREVLGTTNGEVLRSDSHTTSAPIPQLILTSGATQ